MLTSEFRTGDRWGELRRRLQSEGIDPRDAAIGGMWPEGGGTDSILLATRDGRSFVATVEFGVSEDGEISPEVCLIWMWDEISIYPGRRSAFEQMWAVATAVLNSQSQ